MHHFLHGLKVGHRGTVGNGFATGSADFFHDLHGGRWGAALTVHIAAQVIDHDFGATRSQQQRMLLAQAAASPCHDGHAALEIDRHEESFLKKER